MTSVSPTAPASGIDARRPGRAAAFVELTKPRITLLLLITCVAAMLCAARGLPELSTLLLTSLGLAMSSGGASALNHVLDRDIDALMERTARRPVVRGVVSPLEGALFGIALMLAAAALLWLAVNPLTAVLALAGGTFYVAGYTMLLKRSTPQNIVIGGAAGAVPPLVGWAAVDNGLSLAAWVLFAIVFLWTPPHFWALALLIRDDYAQAKVPMLPVVASARATTRQMLLYTLALVACSVIPVAAGDFGVLYLVAALLLGMRFVDRVWKLDRHARTLPPGAALSATEGPGRAAARATFLFSMAYLGLLFAAAVVDQVVWFRPLA